MSGLHHQPHDRAGNKYGEIEYDKSRRKNKLDYVCACGKELPCPDHGKGTVAGEKPHQYARAGLHATNCWCRADTNAKFLATEPFLDDEPTPNTGQTFEEVANRIWSLAKNDSLASSRIGSPSYYTRNAIQAEVQAAVRAARQQGWLGALKWARTQYDEMEGRQSQADKDVTWRGWKWIRNRLTDEIERITGDRVGNQIDATPPALDQTTEGTEA